MNAIKKILTLTIIGAVFLFTGCEKDDTVKTIDKEKAVQTLETNSQEIETSLEEIENTDGMKAMKTLNGLTQKNDPFAKSAADNKTIISNLQEILKPISENSLKRSGDQKFYFEKWVGTYVWQDTKEWNVTLGDPDDKIVIEFPTDTTTDPIENNAVLTINNYHEFETPDSLGNTVYVADTVKLNLEVNDEEVLSIDYTLDYDEANQMVNSLSANVDLNPYSWKLDMTQSSIKASLTNKDNGNVLTSFAFEVTFKDNGEDVKKLNGHVQLRNLNLEGGIKPYNIQRLEDENFLIEKDLTSVEDIIAYVNEQIDISLYRVDTGNKIADLKVIKAQDSEKAIPAQLALVFKDGSEEPAKQYFENVISYVKSILKKYNLGDSKV